jgi:hypothetical protein
MINISTSFMYYRKQEFNKLIKPIDMSIQMYVNDHLENLINIRFRTLIDNIKSRSKMTTNYEVAWNKL